MGATNKFTIEFVGTYVKEHGCKLISTEYLNRKEKLTIEFPCGHLHEMSFGCFRRGQRCPCSGMERFKKSVENKTRLKVIEALVSSEIKLISFENDICSWDGELTYECKNKHIVTQRVREFMRNKLCKICSFENISHRQKGSKGNNWQGGKTSLRAYIEKGLTNWKKDSMKNSNYKCIVTGERFDDIHHLYPLNLIIDEAVHSLGLYNKNTIGEYTQEELEEIKNKVEFLHYKYPLGVCLKKEIHQEFHKIYGNKIFTPDDFYNYINILEEKNGYKRC